MVGQVQRCGTAGCQGAGLHEARSMHEALLHDHMKWLGLWLSKCLWPLTLPLQEVPWLAGDRCVGRHDMGPTTAELPHCAFLALGWGCCCQAEPGSSHLALLPFLRFVLAGPPQ